MTEVLDRRLELACRFEDAAGRSGPFSLSIGRPFCNAREVFECAITCVGLEGLPDVATGATAARRGRIRAGATTRPSAPS